MRLVKSFKAPRPQCSHLSHGQIGLGDPQAALTHTLCLRLGIMVSGEAQDGVTTCWNEQFFPSLALRDQGSGQGNRVPTHPEPPSCSHCLSLTARAWDARHLLIPSASANVYTVPLDAWAWSHLGEDLCREGGAGVCVLIMPKPPYGLCCFPAKPKHVGGRRRVKEIPIYCSVMFIFTLGWFRAFFLMY